jgi:hypothetical protein
MLDANMTKSSLSVEATRVNIFTKRAVGWITVGFVVLGVLLRTIRFGLCFPLYGDEGSLAANFLDRDFAGFFQPLDYGQIAPLGFLWAELAVVKLIGFGEYSLRFLPYVASIASVGLFAMLARRMCGDTIAATLSIAVFGVSLVLIRYAAEVKPYSIDLLISIAILYLALRVIEGKKETHLLWYLALFVPVAVLCSLPSLFVIAGVLFTVGIQFLLERNQKLIVPSIALALSTLVSFVIYYVYFLSPHHEYHKYGMTTFWAGAFPPLDSPFHLVWWFIDIHAGRLMAYPAGDKNFSSAISLLCFIMGAVALWKERRRVALLLMLSPFLMTLGAALLHRYPYGGSARIVQHLAPVVCLLVGMGIDRMIRWRPEPLQQTNGQKYAFAALAVLGLCFAVADGVKPYIENVDPITRDYCRDFWAQNRENTALVVLTSFDHDRTTGILHREATWRCYQQIFAPHATFCSTTSELNEKSRGLEKVVVHLAANNLIDQQRLERAEHWMSEFTVDHDGSRTDDLSQKSGNQLHSERIHVVTLNPSVPSTGSIGQQAPKRTFLR